MFKRPRASNSRSSLSSGAGELYQMWLWPWTKAFKRVRVSSAKGCSRPLRAPWSHQTSLGDASRRAHVENVANLQLFVDVSASHAMGFPLDAQTIALAARFARQRIAAEKRCPPGNKSRAAG
jgi:hypothetical protein